MKLIILFGPPSVGKTTIGQLIEKQTDFKLFHNHMIMDGIMHIFGVGSPSENKLSKIVRTQVIEEAAENGINLIFTYVWNFDHEKGKNNIDTYKKIYEERGGKVIFIELSAPLNVRMERAENPLRKQLKAHAPDGKRVSELESILNFNTPSPFFYPDIHFKINTRDKTPEIIAKETVSIINKL